MLFSNCFSLFPTQDTDHNLSSKKPPLSLFSAADIIQVVPSYSVPLGLQWKDGRYGGKWIISLTHKVNKPVSKLYNGCQALSKSFCFDNNTTTTTNTVRLLLTKQQIKFLKTASPTTTLTPQGMQRKRSHYTTGKSGSVVLECRTVDVPHDLAFFFSLVDCALETIYILQI